MKKLYLLSAILMGSQLFAQSFTATGHTTAGALVKPNTIAQAPGDDRLYVVEQEGSIRIVNTNGTLVAGDWLNIAPRVFDNNNEQGLIGLAFDPNYETNGYFYVNYTVDSAGSSVDGDTRVSRFSRSTINPLVADPNSEVVLLRIDQPYSNHNGGGLAFGPDGYLYIGMGDGGSGGDPGNRAQNPAQKLGKMLRINVNAPTYTTPVSNPYYGVAGYQQEMWSLGMRNPWRFNFDRLSGDLWIGDVGQDAWEEINHAERVLSAGGENYGWRCYEGNNAYNLSGCGPIGNYFFPKAEINQGTGPMCSITMGEVYRGAMWGDIYNKMIFTDYCNDYIWTLTYDTAGAGTYAPVRHTNLPGTLFIVNITQDRAGNIFFLDLTNDRVYKLGLTTCTPAAVIETPLNSTVACDGNPIQLTSAPGIGLTYQWSFNGSPIGGATDSIYLASAAGNYQLTVTNPSCGVNPSATSSILTLGLSTTPAVTVSAALDTVCISLDSVAIVGTPSGGEFRSPYVDAAGTFYPQVAGLGNHQIIYEYTAAGGCTGYDTLTITVNSGPTVGFNFTTDSVCSSYGNVPLTGGTPAGGTYSGTGVTGSNFDPTVGVGNYTLTYTYTDILGCTNQTTDNLLVSGCLGLDDLSFNDIVLFPNPADELVNLNISSNINAQFNMDIVNVDGKLIQQQNIQVGVGANHFSINTSTFASGIYFVQLNDGVHYFAKKIVIQ